MIFIHPAMQLLLHPSRKGCGWKEVAALASPAERADSTPRPLPFSVYLWGKVGIRGHEDTCFTEQSGETRYTSAWGTLGVAAQAYKLGGC